MLLPRARPTPSCRLVQRTPHVFDAEASRRVGARFEVVHDQRWLVIARVAIHHGRRGLLPPLEPGIGRLLQRLETRIRSVRTLGGRHQVRLGADDQHHRPRHAGVEDVELLEQRVLPCGRVLGEVDHDHVERALREEQLVPRIVLGLAA